MNQQQLEILDGILNTFETVIDNKQTEYKHKIKEGSNEWFETKNREEHLEEVMKWATQQLENNFEIGE
ncbi:type II toxin-antitoxin system antitoxin TscA [Staphylococcus pseudoxylosus]|uniref:type II toxin-antitoxin system antitoxin TscA n=1 Tax=Staphylococcus pseudoxylosus TaxID=2282419 RepID=UPI00398AAA7D